MSEEVGNIEGVKKRGYPPSSDEEDAGEEPVVRLDWRMDPEESHSDWKIEVSVGGRIYGTYHVHRNCLSVLSNRSEYFARLFAIKDHAEHATQTSRIEMVEAASNAFPVMLDYVYFLWDKNDKPITVENAVPLHYLGSYFEIRGLRQEARAFWKKDMAANKAGTYLEHAKLFHNDKVYQAVVEKCSSLIRSIKVDSHLMEVSDAKFWLDVLEENNGEPNRALSTLISSFCFKNKEILDTETFLKLTDKSALPQLSVSATMELLQLEKLFAPPCASTGELSSLQKRGVEGLTSCQTNDPPIFAELQPQLKNFSPLVLSQLVWKLWNCNRELQMTRGYLPKEVVVSGAGVDAINGTYSLSTEFREMTPRFTMEGRWRGRPAKFELYAFRGDPRRWKPHWFIAISRDDTTPSLQGNKFYFAANISSDNPRIPTKTGWQSCQWLRNHASELQGDLWAVPTLSFHFDALPYEDADAWYLRK